MPNVLDGNGLQVATRDELIQLFTDAFQAIYGPDIDLSSSSPDGQMMGIFVQAVLDVEDSLVQIYNSWDPDLAIGTQLDLRVALNGIQRQGGTYTITPVSITVSQALNLYGLDQTAQPIYTVADNAGNQWELEVSQTIGAPGTYSYLFRAKNPGRVLTVPNTIVNPVTIVLGVTAINNPATFTTLGTDEETDAALRVRRQISVAIPSQGYYAALKAALLNVPNVTSAFVLENYTDTVDSNGVPAHSIWVIVAGTADPSAIAQAIYVERTAGCGMKGSQSFVITQADGTPFTVYWDDVDLEDLWIKFTASSIDGINYPLLPQIIDQLPGIYIPGVAAEVNINQLATFVQDIDPNTLVTLSGLSLASGGPFTNTLNPSAKNKQLVVASQRIYILPILILPNNPVVARLGTQQFTAYGGKQATYTFTIIANPSGGGITTGGLYTAGNTVATDTIRVTDGDGNHTDLNISVI